MPIICEFSGVKICMYFEDHQPPHVHVIGPGFNALVSIADGSVVAGTLPNRVRFRVAKWVQWKTKSLMDNWARAQKGQSLLRIAPPGER
jgi:hypothetical protein